MVRTPDGSHDAAGSGLRRAGSRPGAREYPEAQCQRQSYESNRNTTNDVTLQGGQNLILHKCFYFPQQCSLPSLEILYKMCDKIFMCQPSGQQLFIILLFTGNFQCDLRFF